MTTADNQPLGQALAENQAFLQTMFGGSSDFYTKSFTICGCRCCIAMFAGLSSPEKLCIMVLHALGQGVPGCKAGPQLVQYLAEQSCLPTEQTPITTRTQLVEALAGGMAVLLAEGSGQGVLDCKRAETDYPQASPGAHKLMEELCAFQTGAEQAWREFV